MTPEEALRELNAADEAAKKNYDKFASDARKAGDQTLQAAREAANKTMATIIIICVAVGVLTWFLGMWYISIPVVGIGIFAAYSKRKKDIEKAAHIERRKRELDSSISSNDDYRRRRS